MRDLDTIRRDNELAALKASRVKVEDNHNRECSMNPQPDGSVILHSAKLRNTGYLTPKQGKRFFAKWYGTNSQEVRNRLVESYF